MFDVHILGVQIRKMIDNCLALENKADFYELCTSNAFVCTLFCLHVCIHILSLICLKRL